MDSMLDATSNILKKESFTIFYVMASVAKIASQDKILILLVVFGVKRHTNTQSLNQSTTVALFPNVFQKRD